MDKNKKIIISVAIAFVLLLIILFIIIKNNKNKENNTSLITNFQEVFEITNVENSNYDIKKTNKIIVASKYTSSSNSYKLNSEVKFYDRIGEIFYLRDRNKNINILNVKYRIDELDSIDTQVDNYINIFRQNVMDYLGTNIEKDNDMLYGDNKTDNINLPLGESIYVENRLYSETYSVINNDTEGVDEEIENNETDIKYDLNFFRDGEYLVCELVKIF